MVDLLLSSRDVVSPQEGSGHRMQPEIARTPAATLLVAPGQRCWSFYRGGACHSPEITVPVNSREGGGGDMKKQRGREKNEVLVNKPHQGRMVQFDTPPATNCKHAHPKLEGEAKSLSGTRGGQRMVTWNSRLARGHFSPS